MLVKIGLFLIIIGVCFGDSECLVLPVALIGLGCWLVWTGIGRGEVVEDETT